MNSDATIASAAAPNHRENEDFERNRRLPAPRLSAGRDIARRFVPGSDQAALEDLGFRSSAIGQLEQAPDDENHDQN